MLNNPLPIAFAETRNLRYRNEPLDELVDFGDLLRCRVAEEFRKQRRETGNIVPKNIVADQK